MEDCILCGIKDDNKTLIKKYPFWTVLINYMQPTLGSSLIVLNRHVETVSELGGFEAIEFYRVAKELEESLRDSFEPDRINHLMLANVVTHVHYHIIPRYSEERSFADSFWEDEKYGHTPKISSDTKDQEVLDKIIKEISSSL